MVATVSWRALRRWLHTCKISKPDLRFCNMYYHLVQGMHDNEVSCNKCALMLGICIYFGYSVLLEQVVLQHVPDNKSSSEVWMRNSATPGTHVCSSCIRVYSSLMDSVNICVILV